MSYDLYLFGSVRRNRYREWFQLFFHQKDFQIFIRELKEFLLLNLRIEKKICNLKQNSKA